MQEVTTVQNSVRTQTETVRRSWYDYSVVINDWRNQQSLL